MFICICIFIFICIFILIFMFIFIFRFVDRLTIVGLSCHATFEL